MLTILIALINVDPVVLKVSDYAHAKQAKEGHLRLTWEIALIEHDMLTDEGWSG